MLKSLQGLSFFLCSLIANSIFAQTAEELCEKAYEAGKKFQYTEATLEAKIQSGVSQNLQDLTQESFTSKFILTLNPASKFSIYQFNSETWQSKKRISGVFFGEGQLIRYLEADSQVTVQTFQGRQSKPILEPHQIFLPWVESSTYFLLPQDRLEAGVIFLERGNDTTIHGTPCYLLIMERDLSTAERVLPPHTYRIALRKSDGLPIAYEMSWQMGEEENRFIYKGIFEITSMKTKPISRVINQNILPLWVKAKAKKLSTKRK